MGSSGKKPVLIGRHYMTNTKSTLMAAILLGGLAFLIPFLGALVGLAVSIFTLVDAIFVLTDSPLRRALHDKWSNTIVVKAQP